MAVSGPMSRHSRTGVMSPKDIGIDKFKKIVTGGEGEMPGFSDLPAHYLDALAAYISNPTAAAPTTRRAGAGGYCKRQAVRSRRRLGKRRDLLAGRCRRQDRDRIGEKRDARRRGSRSLGDGE